MQTGDVRMHVSHLEHEAPQRRCAAAHAHLLHIAHGHAQLAQRVSEPWTRAWRRKAGVKSEMLNKGSVKHVPWSGMSSMANHISMGSLHLCAR